MLRSNNSLQGTANIVTKLLYNSVDILHHYISDIQSHHVCQELNMFDSVQTKSLIPEISVTYSLVRYIQKYNSITIMVKSAKIRLSIRGYN